jgi:hypothetical protein
MDIAFEYFEHMEIVNGQSPRLSCIIVFEPPAVLGNIKKA